MCKLPLQWATLSGLQTWRRCLSVICVHGGSLQAWLQFSRNTFPRRECKDTELKQLWVTHCIMAKLKFSSPDKLTVIGFWGSKHFLLSPGSWEAQLHLPQPGVLQPIIWLLLFGGGGCLFLNVFIFNGLCLLFCKVSILGNCMSGQHDKNFKETRDDNVFTGEFAWTGSLLTLLLFEENTVLKKNRSQIKPMVRFQMYHIPSLRHLLASNSSPNFSRNSHHGVSSFLCATLTSCKLLDSCSYKICRVIPGKN